MLRNNSEHIRNLKMKILLRIDENMNTWKYDELLTKQWIILYLLPIGRTVMKDIKNKTFLYLELGTYVSSLLDRKSLLQ